MLLEYVNKNSNFSLIQSNIYINWMMQELIYFYVYLENYICIIKKSFFVLFNEDSFLMKMKSPMKYLFNLVYRQNKKKKKKKKK